MVVYHADVAVILQEHPSWGDKQLYLDFKNPMEKGNTSGVFLIFRLVLTLSWKQQIKQKKKIQTLF